jgi:hypothetical protein
MTILAGAAITGVALAQSSTTTTVTRENTYPPTGLASSETIQINVTNTASNASNGTAASCTGSISFVNASGATIGTATNFTATSGQTVSVSMPFSKVGAAGNRTVVRGQITVTLTSGVPCAVSSSLETFDTTTGATHIYQPNGDGGILAGPGFGR